jgi:hypothetical protein
MSRVIFQIGYCNNKKLKQSIKAFVNDEAISWAANSGRFLTTQKDRVLRGTTWYMCETDLSKEDILRLEVKTFLSGIGLDEERSFEALYYVNEEAPVRNIECSGVGSKSYPIVKGRILEMASVSEDDKRKSAIEDFMKKDFN